MDQTKKEGHMWIKHKKVVLVDQTQKRGHWWIKLKKDGTGGSNLLDEYSKGTGG